MLLEQQPSQIWCCAPGTTYPEHFLSHRPLVKYYHSDIKECIDVLNAPRADPMPQYEKQCDHRITLVFDLDETLLKSVSDLGRFPSPVFD